MAHRPLVSFIISVPSIYPVFFFSRFSCHETWYAILGAALATAIFCGFFCVYENVGKEKQNNEKAPKSKGEEVNLIKS